MKPSNFFGIFLGILIIGLINGEVDICFDFDSEYISETEGSLKEIQALRTEADKEIENIISSAQHVLAAESENYTYFHFNFSHPAVTLEGTFANGTTYTEEQTVRLWTIKEEGLEIFNLTFPYIFMNGSYDAKGYVGAHRLFDIYGNGTFHLNMTNFTLAVVTGLVVNSTALCLPFTVNVYLNDYKSNFDEFMNGEIELDPLLNGVIQDIVPDAVRIIFRESMDGADPYIQAIIDKILHGSKTTALSKLLYMLTKNVDKLNSIF